MKSLYNKKAGKGLSGMSSVSHDMPGNKQIKSSVKKVDAGFYGHLSPYALKEDSQIITSVDTIVEGC